MDISILPAGTTSVMHLLDISINKKFKTYIREKYISTANRTMLLLKNLKKMVMMISLIE